MKLALVAITGLATVPLLFGWIGFRINETNSAPTGLWITNEAREIKRGMLVSVCPPESEALTAMKSRNLIPSGNCHSGTQPLLKAIGAIPGDTVTVRNGSTITVNGEPVPNTAAIGSIKWKEETYRVKDGEVWIFSTYVANSFDSRYFGPVKTGNIQAEARPVFVDGNIEDMRKGLHP